MRLPLLCLLLGPIMIAGCASYAVPGRGAPMQMFGATEKDQAAGADAWIKSEMNRKPLASFPAAVAIARVQAPGYTSYSRPATCGDGRFTVVTARDVETPEQMDRLAHLPRVRGLAPMNSLVIPSRLQTDEDLRQAAAKLRADILLVYTLDTRFIEQDRSNPLTLITLGITPTDQMKVSCTASAALLDTRSGYLYGLAESTENREAPRNAWATEMEIDRFRQQAEQASFSKLVGELQRTWGDVVKEYATAPTQVGRYETPR
jgi:hypothetical protein